MGCNFYFDKDMTALIGQQEEKPCTVEVCDNHAVPEIRVGPEGAAYAGWTVPFRNWRDFAEFRQAVNTVYEHLQGFYDDPNKGR